MSYKKSSILFMALIVLHIIIVAMLYIFPGLQDYMTGAVELFLGQGIIFFPTLFYVIGLVGIKKIKLSEIFAFKKIRAGSALMLIVYALLLLPVVMVLNLFSMLFTENAMTSASDMLLSYSWPAVLLSVGVAGPLCEEMVFRGVIFGGMKKSVSVRAAIIMSALTFGLMHMNFNQAIYTFPLGIFMALAVEATGSLWGSLIIHMTVNLEQTGVMLLADHLMPGIYSDPELMSMSADQIYMALGVYMVIALVSGVLAVCALVWISGHEGRTDNLKSAVFSEKKEKAGNIFVWPMCVAIVLALGYMIFELVLERLV